MVPINCPEWTTGPAPPPGRAAQISQLAEYWLKLWSPETKPEPNLGEWLAPLGDLSPFPVMPMLDGIALRSVVKNTADSKAPGAIGCDGRSEERHSLYDL